MGSLHRLLTVLLLVFLMPNDGFYSTAAWRRLRLRVLQRDGYLCQIRRAGCTLRATQVDHIIPRKDLPAGSTLNLDDTNLRASCANCNSARINSGWTHTQPSRNW